MAAPFAETAPVTAPDAALDPEQRLAALAHAGGPLRRAVAALSGRLVATEGWGRLGYARLGDYARERLGLSGRSLQEFARVDGALAELPRLEAALVSGQLPWSKVRLLARFVSADDEAGWIAFAARTGVRHLERACRAVDRGARDLDSFPLTTDAPTTDVLDTDALNTDEEGADTAPTDLVRLGAPLAIAFKWKRTRAYAAKVAGERISAAVALEMVTAEVLSGLPFGLDVRDEEEAAVGRRWVEGDAAEVPVAPDLPDLPEPGSSAAEPVEEGAELPAFLAPLLRGLERADAFELDARLRRTVRLEQRLDAEIAPLLRQVMAAEFPWRERFHTLASYARERLGLSPRKARALLGLERVGDVCPELRTAYRDGGLSWVQAQVLAPLLLLEVEGRWRGAWVAWATQVTVRRLEALVEQALWLRESDPQAWGRLREDPEQLDASLATEDRGVEDSERQVCARPRDRWSHVTLRVRVPRDVARLFRAVLCTLRRAGERETGRLPSEADTFEAMLDHALVSWGVDDLWLRQRLRKHPVFERDGWRCTVPGCSSRRSLHAHHVVFRSRGGSDALENQTTLCAHHHQRGVHGGTLRISGRAPHHLWYELGTRAGKPPLALYRSGDRLAIA